MKCYTNHVFCKCCAIQFSELVDLLYIINATVIKEPLVKF